MDSSIVAPPAPTPLARAMTQAGLSQRRLAERAGVALRTVHEAHQGRIVSMEVSVKLARALGVPLKTISPVWAEALDGVVIR